MGNISFDYTGCTVLVTGGAQGIGLELARLFQRAGADVFAVDLDDEAMAKASTDGLAVIRGDVSSSDDAARIVETVVAATGQIDVLVNNAGILRDASLAKMTDDQWDQVLAVHTGGTFRMTRACIPHFRAQHYGRVINVSSYAGLHGNVGQANYSTAKAGIVGFTKTAARELARHGVTVNAIVPGAMTRMVASIPEEKLVVFASMIPVGRMAEPAEIAPAVGFLASEEAGYITGAVLEVDGGLSM